MGRTFAEEQAALHEAVLDFAYAFLVALGLVKLVRRMGMDVKPWVREREIRVLHR